MKNHAIVSNPSEELILVDSDDRVLGSLPKAECHAGDGVLHRAFSVFLFNAQDQLLLQKRSASKPLWPLYWANSCCSHPRNGECVQTAAHRRLREELGVECDLSFIYKFEYHARFSDVGAEHELCHVFLGRYDGEIRANGNEIAEWRFAPRAEIDSELANNPEQFTPWFKLEWARMRDIPAAATR